MSLPIDTVRSALDGAPAIIANVSVFAIFAAVVVAGIVRGLKEFRDFTKPTSSPNQSAQITAATILENVTLSEWTASNREVVVAVTRLCDLIVRHHDEMADVRRVMEDVQHELHRGSNR